MKLSGTRIAILVAKGFEQVELTEPRRALDEAGAATTVISPEMGMVRAWNETDWGIEVPVDQVLAQADADDYDALLLPGGVMNPDYLRREPKAVEFVKAFMEAGKPVAAICHGPWLLAEAEVVAGRRLTSFSSIKTDLRHAGADWVDEPVVVDNNLITSRKPADIQAFNQAIIDTCAHSQGEAVVAGSGSLAPNSRT